MSKGKEIVELLPIWMTVATGIMVTILPWLQFIAVCLAIAVSVKKLFLTKKEK
jgi:hypothetical protein